jgi:dipeptidyl aminopeptidase/acylaminoacyl peptidase
MTYRLVAALAVIALACAAGSAWADPPPIQAFANLPELAGPKLSPDGTHLAVVQAQNGRPIARIYPVNGPAGSQPVTCASPDGVIAGLEWANNNRLIIFVTVKRREGVYFGVSSYARAISVDASCANGVILLKQAVGIDYNPDRAAILDSDPTDSNFVYIEAYGDNGRGDYLNIYRVNLTTGEGKIWKGGYGTIFTADWLMDGRGQVAARIDVYARELKMHVKVPKGDDFQEVAAFDLGANANAEIEGLMPDGTFAIRARNAQGMEGLYPLNPANGTLGSPVYSNTSYDMGIVLGDHETHRVNGVTFEDDRMQFVYFDAAEAKLQKTLEASFPGKTVILASTDHARDAYVVMVESATSPPVYYYFQPATMHAAIIGTSYPGLVNVTLGEVRPYSYKARDGQQIHGYLTIPAGRDAKNLPMVVFPHGGPVARDAMDFDWWAQFMASRGYLVFQPNFRGSSGYGGAFQAAGYKQWGLRMQDDVTDGVKQLIADGTVDPKRICIVGASYGGYAALAGAAFTPDLYACAVSVSGLSDIQKLVAEIEHDWGSKSDIFSIEQAQIGDPDTEAAQLKAASPALHADKVKIPILLIHGRDDTTVPIRQSVEMQTAMQDAGKTVQFIQIDGEDHYMKFGQTRVTVLTEIEKFLAANIGR